MDADLNRAGSTSRQRWLVIAVTSCISGTLSAAETAAPAGRPQRISAASASRLVTASDRDPSLFVHEPLDEMASGWDRGAILDAIDADANASRLPGRLVASGPRENSSRQSAALERLSSAAPVESARTSALPGFSTASIRQAAAALLDESAARLAHQASYSAAAAAMESLRLIAQSSDAIQRDSHCSTELTSAMVAIREAEDFVGRYGFVDDAAIARMIRSHETSVLKGASTSHLTGLVAADIYLDSARRTLATIAAEDPLAATAIGLLAKSYRQRASESPLALATSVHLMRAAVTASPADRGLAIELAAVLEQAKLHVEADAVLADATRMQPSQDRTDNPFSGESVIAVVSGTQTGGLPNEQQQLVRIEQLSPGAFATVSRAEAGPVGSATSTTATAKAPASAAKREGNSVSRTFKSMTRMWR